MQELLQDEKIKEQILGKESSDSGPAKYQSAYEIIGPVMVGPSSSHTAGAVRIGNIAYQLLNEKPLSVRFSSNGLLCQNLPRSWYRLSAISRCPWIIDDGRWNSKCERDC